MKERFSGKSFILFFYGLIKLTCGYRCFNMYICNIFTRSSCSSLGCCIWGGEFVLYHTFLYFVHLYTFKLLNESMPFKPLSVWYIGECMVSIININHGIKEPTLRYQNCNTSQILIYGWYVKGERIFVETSYDLGQYHSIPY